MNSDFFLVMCEVIYQWFSLVTSSLMKIIGKHLMRDQKNPYSW